MPLIKRDEESGALIFHQTTQEKEFDEMKKKIEELEKIVKKHTKEIKEVKNTNNKAGE